MIVAHVAYGGRLHGASLDGDDVVRGKHILTKLQLRLTLTYLSSCQRQIS